MFAKNVVHNLPDSQLIRIFLDFVQTFHLQYEKIDKEISYKCHEATWILATTKATGYGRTQSEAYKHALRNLLEMLIEDPPYAEYFCNTLPKQMAQLNPKSIKSATNSHSLSNSTNPLSQNHPASSYEYYRRRQHKTEVEEDDKISNTDPYSHQFEQKSIKLNEAKANANNNSHSRLTIFSGPSNQKNHQTADKEKKQIYHSKINLNRNVYAQSSSSSTSKNIEEQLKAAQARMIALEEELAQINQQNKALKCKLKQQQQKNIPKMRLSVGSKPPSSQVSLCPAPPKQITNNYQLRPEKQLSTQTTKLNEVSENQSSVDKNKKILIPKLKLEILPNYHKKSQKSLNQSLLAVYNEKHENSKKVI